jgi:hypothetical protein
MTRLLVALLVIALAHPVWAQEARELKWTDLVPPVGALADPLAELPMDVRYDLGFVAKVLADAKRGSISSTGPEFRHAMALKERLRGRGIDVDRLVGAVANRDAEIARRSARMNVSLNGQIVRIAGYALPLELSDGDARELLLVPYVGACIHVPPPPANQIIHAHVAPGWKPKGLYDPVWITGRLEARESTRSLSFVDGQADIAMGYAMQVSKIEAYK